MKKILTLLLLLIIAFLAYSLIASIKEPIAFQKVKNERKEAVVAQLEQVRMAQEAYESIKGKYADNFDSLKYVLTHDSFRIENIIGDPDDPTGGEFQRFIVKKSALDSIRKLGIELDGLEIVPFSDGKVFTIESDTLTYQSTLVNVCQVSTRWKDFMGEYASRKYSKYDNSYDPNKAMKFGDMTAPNLSGNWDR